MTPCQISVSALEMQRGQANQGSGECDKIDWSFSKLYGECLPEHAGPAKQQKLFRFQLAY